MLAVPAKRRLLGVMGVLLLGTALVGGTAVYVTRNLLNQDRAASMEAQRVIELAKLYTAAERMAVLARGYRMTGDPQYLAKFHDSRERFESNLTAARMRAHTPARAEELARIQDLYLAYRQGLDEVTRLRDSGASDQVLIDFYRKRVQPHRDNLDAAMNRALEEREDILAGTARSVTERGSSLVSLATAVAATSLGLVLVMAFFLLRLFLSLGDHQGRLEQALQRVQTINQDLDAFAGRVAHDLGNALAPVTLLAGHLARLGRSDPKIAPVAGRIVGSVRRAEDMIHGLLAFSRTSQVSESARCAGAVAIGSVIEEIAATAAGAQVAIGTELANVTVACSESMFRQVVANLVGNAIKFLHGRERRRVDVRLRVVDDHAELEVEDTGPGISVADQTRIFEPFYRVPGTRVPGAGIGLTTVKRIVDAHGGSIQVSSAMGVGTTFRIRFGLAAAAAPAVVEAMAPATIPVRLSTGGAVTPRVELAAPSPGDPPRRI